MKWCVQNEDFGEKKVAWVSFGRRRARVSCKNGRRRSLK